MAGAEAIAEFPPRIDLRQTAAEPVGNGEWNMTFSIENRSAEVLQLAAARLPHGQFRSEEQRFEPPFDLAPGQTVPFLARVHCDEPAGLVTENAFVIYSVLWKGSRWRIFVRIRVVIDADGTPQTNTESITTQKVGFSGINH